MVAHAARLGVAPIGRVLPEHGMPIAPSTYSARLTSPVSAAELADASAITGPLRQPQVRTSMRRLDAAAESLGDGDDYGPTYVGLHRCRSSSSRPDSNTSADPVMADLTQLRCLLDSRRVSPLAGAPGIVFPWTPTAGAHRGGNPLRA